MQHLTRWRTVTAAATTAALAAGAFGVANAVSGNVEQPAAIELAPDAAGEDLPVVDDVTRAPDTQVPPTMASPDEPSAILPPTPASVVSAAEADQAAEQAKKKNQPKPTKRVQKDLKLELEKKKVFGKKKVIPEREGKGDKPDDRR